MRITSTVIILAGLFSSAVSAAAQDYGSGGKQARLTAALDWSAAPHGSPAAAPPLASAKSSNPQARYKAGEAASRSGGTYLKDDAAFRSVRLQPRTPRTPPADAGAPSRTVAKIWNQYGGMIEVLSRRLGARPEAAVAVIAAESDGRAFVEGRPVIRFEIHKFWEHWGQHNPETFKRHFRFRRGVNQPSEDHEFREAAGGQWSKVHGVGQPQEWRAFLFARNLSRPAALKSASWGMPQILGSNHDGLGYPSPEAMTESFSDPRIGPHMQILGLFDFIRGGRDTSPALIAFRNRDWLGFAKIYNGSSRAPVYSSRLHTYYEAATRLMRP
jgi:hypothetical protein